jgi:hypothetical protein
MRRDDPSVLTDLMRRALVALGATPGAGGPMMDAEFACRWLLPLAKAAIRVDCGGRRVGVMIGQGWLRCRTP